MEKCLILMATYNGGKYIKKQIESIINQSVTDWKLIVRDDGSKDETIEIIEKYVNEDLRIELVRNESEYHGAYLNFWQLILRAKKIEPYQYYFFADQDDIWEKEKLEIFINNAERYADIPLYIYSDMSTIDGSDNFLLKSVNATMGISMGQDRKTLFYSQGYVWGCASMINRKLFELVTPMNPKTKGASIISHDNFYAKHALILGKVVFINNALIKHRRHGNNTTGDYSMRLTPLLVIKKGLISLKETAKTHALGYDQTLYTIDWMIKNGINERELLLIKKSILTGGLQGVCQMLRFHVRRHQLARTLGVYIIMLFRWYIPYLNYKEK